MWIDDNKNDSIKHKIININLNHNEYETKRQKVVLL